MPVSSHQGPVAITGAAGFIGSHVCKNLVEHGYTVRACVRDASRREKVEHLLDLNGRGVGGLEVISADMLIPGAYDAIFTGCTAVFHVAADIGNDPKYGDLTPERLYRGLFEATGNVLASAERCQSSVRRVIFTSSTAAVMGPAPKGHVWTEADWAGAGGHEDMDKKWGGAWNIQDNSYAKGKVDAELFAYDWGQRVGIDVLTVCPCHVLGPILCKAHHHTAASWPHRLGAVFAGRYSYDMMWNITDVRDIADAQRRMAESMTCGHGERFNMVSAGDGSGEVNARHLVEILRELYPQVRGIGGKKSRPIDRDEPHARCRKAEEQLGLRCHIVRDTIRDTMDALESFGCIEEIRAMLAAKAAERAKIKSKAKAATAEVGDKDKTSKL